MLYLNICIVLSYKSLNIYWIYIYPAPTGMSSQGFEDLYPMDSLYIWSIFNGKEVLFPTLVLWR